MNHFVLVGTTVICKALVKSCWSMLRQVFGQTERQREHRADGRSPYGANIATASKQRPRQIEKRESEKASRGMKKGWDVSMGNRVSVASCVWVSEGQLSGATGASGQRAL